MYSGAAERKYWPEVTSTSCCKNYNKQEHFFKQKNDDKHFSSSLLFYDW